MEVHQLRYFVAVAETGSFTRAAARSLVAQPSLSQQIQKLERELRRPLFDRLGRHVQLTEAGLELLPRAQSILAALDETARIIREEPTPGQGQLTLGAIPTLAPYLLPRVLTRFLKRYPRVEMRLREDVTPGLLQALHAGEIDLALLSLPLDDAQLTWLELGAEPLLAALPKGHRLARRRTLRADDLANEPFILLGDMHCLAEQVTAYCRQSGFAPRLACRSVQLSTIQEMIGLGLGVSLLPALARAADKSGRVAYRHLGKPGPSRTIAVAWHKHRYLGPTARLFRDFLPLHVHLAPANGG